MSAENVIKELAEQIAAQSQDCAVRLSTKLRDAKRVVAEIQAELDATNLAFKNLEKFRFFVGREPQCPRCGILDRRQVSLIPTVW